MITSVVLAAGMSRRMGRTKQLLSFKGRPMLVHVVETLLESHVDEVIVVVGFQSEIVANAVQDLPVHICVNDNYSAGLSSSIVAGLREMSNRQTDKPHSQGILISLADQPLVQPETINALVERYKMEKGIVAPFFQGIRGNPVIFDSKFFLNCRF